MGKKNSSTKIWVFSDIRGLRIEQWCGDTICSFWEDDKRMIYPNRIKEFKSFQRMFAKNIREQGVA